MFEGIEFETRSDEWQPTAEELAFQREVEDLTAEQSWSNPNEFGHIETSFGAHLRAMERRSEELGIYRVYSDDDKNVIDRIQGLQETYLSRDEFIQLICECPEEFGYSPEQANALFGHNHDHNHLLEEEGDKAKKDELGPDGKKKKKKTIADIIAEAAAQQIKLSA